jgi:hypothetical protein
VPVIRHLMALVVLALAAFIFCASVPDVRQATATGVQVDSSNAQVAAVRLANDVEPTSSTLRRSAAAVSPQGVAKATPWGTLLIRELFLLCAAALGAGFAGLYRASRYVLDMSFEPQYIYTYYVRLVLGVTAGIILADFIPVPSDTAAGLSKPLLALLGGFSATAVYRILQRLVETVEAIFRGSPDERDQIVRTQAEVEAMQSAESQRGRLTVLAVGVKSAVAAANSPQEVQESVDELLAELLPASGN